VFSLLRRYPAFARVFWADLCAQLGQNMLVVALPTLILEVTGDIRLTGLSFSGEILAFGLVSPWSGWLADRYPQKPLMLLANTLRFGLLGLLLWGLHQGFPNWMALLLSAGVGAAGALFTPARAAFLRRILEGQELQAAVALEGTAQFLVRPLGPVLMGLLLLACDARAGIVFNMLLYLVSNWMLWPTWVRGGLASGGTAQDHDWRGGWRLILTSAQLRQLLSIDLLISLVGMAAWSTVVALLELELHLKAANNGWLQAAMGLAGALGTRLAGRLPGGKGPRWLVLLVIASSYLGLHWAHSLPGLVVMWSVRGLAVGALVVMIAQSLAREVPPEYMGRVYAAWDQAVLLACLAGSLASPVLIDQIGPRRAFDLYAMVFWAGVALLWLRRKA
jgi:NRE family putative nickel resistance protein-like MFS transporter